MTREEWLACTDPEAMLRTGRGNTAQRNRFFQAYLFESNQLYPGGTILEALHRQGIKEAFHLSGWGKCFNAKASARLAEQLRCLIPYRRGKMLKAWVTPTVVTLAEAIYQSRAFDRLPILADALEEAGCDNQDILQHCRGDGPHVRGCFVIDAILSKG